MNTSKVVYANTSLGVFRKLRPYKNLADIFFPSMEALKPNLTDREIEVLGLIAQGLTSVRIAQRLEISFETVKVHRRNMLRKVEVDNTFDLIRLAIRERWIHS